MAAGDLQLLVPEAPPTGLELRVLEQPGEARTITVVRRGGVSGLEIAMFIASTAQAIRGAWFLAVPAIAVAFAVRRWYLHRRGEVLLEVQGDQLRLADGRALRVDTILGIEAVGSIDRELRIRCRGRSHTVRATRAHVEFLARWLEGLRVAATPRPAARGDYWLWS